MTIKRVLGAVLALALAVSCLLCSGCSTPDVAMQVGDKVYEMGDYLAYMYGTMYTDATSYTYLSYYGADAFAQKVTYGENAEVIPLSDYIIKTTQDAIIRQKALEDLLAENKLGLNAELLKEAEEEIKTLKPDQFLPLGFNNERYIRMYKAIALNEESLFLGLYDDGGSRAVSDADERKWFDEHYYSYKIIEIPLYDGDGKELAADKIKAIEDQLKGYLDLYNEKGKNSAAFDEAYRKYLADTTKEEDKKEEDKEDTTSSETEIDSDDLEEEEVKTADRMDIVDTDTSVDENLVKAIKELKEGEIGIKTYQAGGNSKMMALILRMDPEAERGKDEDGKEIDYYADCHEQTLHLMKDEEFNKMVDEKVTAVKATVTVNNRAVKAADPEDMFF